MYAKDFYGLFCIVYLCSLGFAGRASAQLMTNRKVISASAITSRPFGGKVLNELSGVTCPGQGPFMIRSSNAAPAGPYYIANSALAAVQAQLQQTQAALADTRARIDRITRDGGTPSQQTQQEESALVEQMKTLRAQAASLGGSAVTAGKWILGNYTLVSAPCYTDAVPPVPVHAYAVTLYGVSRGAQVIRR